MSEQEMGYANTDLMEEEEKSKFRETGILHPNGHPILKEVTKEKNPIGFVGPNG